jgi:DNA-binding response OmpR family regulator
MPTRILVVEDDRDLNDFVALLMQAEGYEVAQAFDGTDGVDKALAFRPDLLVLDLMLPGLHGYQVARKLRADPGLGKVKILVASAKSFPEDIQGAKDAGADDYLVKPYDAATMRERVAALLAG